MIRYSTAVWGVSFWLFISCKFLKVGMKDVFDSGIANVSRTANSVFPVTAQIVSTLWKMNSNATKPWELVSVATLMHSTPKLGKPLSAKNDLITRAVTANDPTVWRIIASVTKRRLRVPLCVNVPGVIIQKKETGWDVLVTSRLWGCWKKERWEIWDITGMDL